ncbi:MmgE/PrpD family protein [Burkholderia sp. L27(2015)]|uniref:MmgE/PrpD family protein n=1 Tax=Burkholderia sp. L27(2015) TaxID=1641858 RepID=UPI00131AF8F8|nr:MmgE/PrpD family protein [Burkholderia sp. L27(2015)]
MPALLAYAEWQKVSGAELVHAYVLGVEVEERVGLSVFPVHYDRGWHITGTAGVFGAAAAVGKLLGLDEQRMAWALSIAATQSSGLREMFGSMCKSLHPGRAAQNGMAAALLAKSGFTSSERGIEAPRGFGHVMSSRFDPEFVVNGLGERYEIMQNMYKPFACGLVVHPVIDGCLQLRRELQLDTAQISQVVARVNPLVMELTAKRAPTTGLESKFSVYHALAVALIYGAAGEAEFSIDVVSDPRVIALRERVSTQPDAALRKLEGHVRIELHDGRVFERRVENAVCSLAHPMSNDELEQKFLALVEGILPIDRANALIDGCWKIAAMDDAGEIARLAATGPL